MASDPKIGDFETEELSFHPCCGSYVCSCGADDNEFVCGTCGSPSVLELQWVNPNEPVGYIEGPNPGEGRCQSCDSDCRIITRSDFNAKVP